MNTQCVKRDALERRGSPLYATYLRPEPTDRKIAPLGNTAQVLRMDGFSGNPALESCSLSYGSTSFGGLVVMS